MIVWGDATSYLGDYMCTLATEYALLKSEGKDTKATLNELYYAINSIDRLDGFGEKLFDPNQPINYNGFFVRDDIDNTIANKWNSQYSGSFDPLLNYKCYDASALRNLDTGVPNGLGNSSTN